MNGADASETKDPAIKLFGKTIPVPEYRIPAKSDGKSDVGFQIPFNSEATVSLLCRFFILVFFSASNLRPSFNQSYKCVIQRPIVRVWLLGNWEKMGMF